MTISTTESRISYNGNGATTVFSFPYRFLANGDLVVLAVSALGVETIKTLTTDYTLTGAGDEAGGSVTMLVAPASGTRLVIYRDTGITQETDYISGDPFPAETHERALDRLTMIAQELAEADSLSLRLSEGTSASVSTELPLPEANKLIGWDSAGTALANYTSAPEDVSISAFMETVLVATDEAAARAAIDAAVSGNNTDITSLRGLIIPALAPAADVADISIRDGAISSQVTRTGGTGQYGNWLSEYLVTAATSSPQFDTGITSWITHTNLTGGASFGMWATSNTPSAGLGQTFSSGSVIGMEINAGNRWADFGLLSDVSTRYTVGLQVVPDVGPALDGLDTKAVTISIATPGVVTLASNGATNGMGVKFQGAGTIPTGLAKDTTYYVVSAATNTFQVAATPGGSAIATTGSFVAPITCTLSWPGSFGVLQGPSIWGHRWWIGYFNRYDTIMPGGYLNRDGGGSIASQAPLGHTKIEGFWTNGIDFSSGSYANACMKFSAGQVSGTATAGGGVAVPATVNGFLIVDVGGVLKRVPYFNV